MRTFTRNISSSENRLASARSMIRSPLRQAESDDGRFRLCGLRLVCSSGLFPLLDARRRQRTVLYLDIAFRRHKGAGAPRQERIGRDGTSPFFGRPHWSAGLGR